MKKTLFSLFMLALLPVLTHAQADQKLMNKAQQGDTKAMVLLGECYENGAGVDIDSALALKWFQRAADQGDGEGWLRISRYYMHSTLLPRDTARYLPSAKSGPTRVCLTAWPPWPPATSMASGWPSIRPKPSNSTSRPSRLAPHGAMTTWLPI